ncbi:MAG TPA: molybdopterin-dependent oxidoreductase [Anaerolineales bacterium]|nr:molybdopterin-dependent oxidoreductase [Anaerolineales bacterium]
MTGKLQTPNFQLQTSTQPASCGITRRDFLKLSAVAGGGAFLGALPNVQRVFAQSENGGAYELAKITNQINTVCLQCNTVCGIKVKLLDGVAAKIDGSPYSPWTLSPHLKYDTPLVETGSVEGAICPKGQAGLQTVYDPYRIVKALKRKPGTQRGQNQWVTVEFDQALQEIVDGGDLFGEGPVPGLKDSFVLTDSKVAKAMADEVKKILAEKDAEKKAGLLAEFKKTFAADLDKLIDPDHPDFGPKNNQVVFNWGRLKGGRSDFINRFTRDGFGSTNTHGHTTVCQGSLYFSGKAMSEKLVDGKWSGGDKFYWQGDVRNSEFVIFVGASPFEGNYGPPWRSGAITQGMVDGRLKYAVVDPRLSKTAAKATKWIPIQPGTEGAMALALIGWVIDHEKHDAKYLSAANKSAATKAGYSTWTEAAWLVKLDTDGNPSTFLRASEIGLKEKEPRPLSTDPEKTYDFDYFVVMQDGQPVPFDPYSEEEGSEVSGDLLVDNAKLGDFTVKSGLQIIADSAHEHTLEEWAAICGVKASDLEWLATEFTSHGKKACADIHRGVSQHTNGFYNVVAWYTLNALIGNYDFAGGMIKLTAYDAAGGKAGQPFPLGSLSADKQAPFGLSIIRHDAKYQESTIYSGLPEDKRYPAQRNWYPLSSDIYQEVIPSIGDAYPYPVKALFLYMGSPVYALPAGHKLIEILTDPKKLPLFVTFDVTIGETSMYSDYIFPDTSYLERWEFNGSHPSIPFKVQGIRQPAIAPLTPEVKVYGQTTVMSLESVLMGLAEKLGFKNFGPGGMKDGGDLTHPDHLILKMVANVAFGEKEDGSDAVPDADETELSLFEQARRHLPKSVFDIDRWKSIVGEALWPKVVFVLNRGGRFQNYADGYKGSKVANKYGRLINIYQEKTYGVKSSMTGKHLAGYAKYLPAPVDVTGQPIDDGAEYDLRLITYREIFQTKSRTSGNYWLTALLPENMILMNAVDAAARGLAHGDPVKITSASNPEGVWDLKNGTQVPMIGKVKVLQGIRPGVIAFALGFGHFAYGSVDFNIDGTVIQGEARRGRGVHANAAMRVDPYLGNTPLVDAVGGSAVFYDTMVKVVKA